MIIKAFGALKSKLTVDTFGIESAAGSLLQNMACYSNFMKYQQCLCKLQFLEENRGGEKTSKM